MSMDKLEAVPVDTHVLNIAKSTYDFAKDTSNKGNQKKTNNLTDKSYKAIGIIILFAKNIYHELV